MTYLKFPTIKGDISINADALQRRTRPQISGLQETKTELQSMNFFLDHRSLQTCSRNIQFHPPALENAVVLFQMPGNATQGVVFNNVHRRLVVLLLHIRLLSEQLLNKATQMPAQKLHSFVYLLQTGTAASNGTK